MNIIFLISLPRSGSTLVQRALCSCADIDSAAEPWIMLPIFSAMSDSVDVAADFSFSNTRKAQGQYFNTVGEDRLFSAIRAYAYEAYGLQSGRVFLDKTPRYSLIVDELIEVFPDASFIFLVRNPLDVINSIVNTWGDGGKRWRVRPYYVDLYSGLGNIVKHVDSDRAECLIRYEDFVESPESNITSILKYCGINDRSPVDLEFSDVVTGDFGDKTGVDKYQDISSDSVSNLNVFCNFYRRWWAKKYLKSLGRVRLETIGYDIDVLINSVDSCSGQRYLFNDLLECGLQFLKVLVPLRRFGNHGIKKFLNMSELR